MRALLFLGLVGCMGGAGSGAELVGEVAPDFELLDADGVGYRLSEQAGDVVVVDFSAMWCTRCKDTAPELEGLYQDRAEDGVQVWVVLFQDANGDDPDAADLKNWTQAFGLTHPVLADQGEEVWSAWGEGHQPVVFVVDPGGSVVWTGDGPGQREAIEDAIDGVL